MVTKTTQRGFTIIELLIVIVVIGILAAIVLVTYNSVQARARDASRDSAVETIKKAVELYNTDNGSYPKGVGGNCVIGSGYACTAIDLTSDLSTYIPTVPQDPQYPTKKIYYATTSTGAAYGLLISYETKPACKTGVNISAGWWGTSTPYC